tara:strand:+ start:483 stop:2339 length:1857 start_codon:yes stop_codon:yes gene_type:complete
MNNQKSKNKLNFLLVPFLILYPLFLNSYSSENEGGNIVDEAEEIIPLIDEVIYKKNKKQQLIQKDKFDFDDKKTYLKDAVENKQSEEDNLNDSIKNKKAKDIISNQEVLFNEKRKDKSINKLSPVPRGGDIYTGQFEIPLRGYVKLKDQKISVNLKDSDPIAALKLIGKLGNYGIVIVENDKKEQDSTESNKKLITVSFDEIDISDVFNSILMSSNLQAKIEKNIIFIGEDILNKSLNPSISKTYRINQANAASVADYLKTLGARISKVLVKGSSNDGAEISDRLQQANLEDSLIDPYGNEGGPLNGLIGTVDLRLQTITLIGSQELINTSEKYIKAMDRRHKQVALNVKIIDVALSKQDTKRNMLEFRTGETRVISNAGLSVRTGNEVPGIPDENSLVQTPFGGLAEGVFANWLMAKITNNDAKIMASPTLILGENNDPNLSGAAQVDDALGQATIGRPFSNEGFIKVGETVITKFERTIDEGGAATCLATEGTAGITFGAKVDKIDDNGYVTFSLSPAISSVTGTVEIVGCGIQSTLSVRKLDTGAIRVKNKDTLVLTGVIKDEDSTSTSKVPILGDIPLLGSLFRDSRDIKKKSELIILVTPKILNDDLSVNYEL